ncbi:MAG: hypothetical protein Q8P41_04905 [Pseudomonadota bacterium]|nr:hypothetical protein [Pseudomonadota bacterium]
MKLVGEGLFERESFVTVDDVPQAQPTNVAVLVKRDDAVYGQWATRRYGPGRKVRALRQGDEDAFGHRIEQQLLERIASFVWPGEKLRISP